MQLMLQSQMRALHVSASKFSPAASWRISPVSVQPSSRQQQVPRHTGRLPALRALDADKYGGNEKVLDVSQLLLQVSTITHCSDATAGQMLLLAMVDLLQQRRFSMPSPAINAAAVLPGT
jgi:hypothetical protein